MLLWNESGTQTFLLYLTKMNKRNYKPVLPLFLVPALQFPPWLTSFLCTTKRTKCQVNILRFQRVACFCSIHVWGQLATAQRQLPTSILTQKYIFITVSVSPVESKHTGRQQIFTNYQHMFAVTCMKNILGTQEVVPSSRAPVWVPGVVLAGFLPLQAVPVPLSPPDIEPPVALLLAGRLPLQRPPFPPLGVFPPHLLRQLIPSRLDQLLAGKLSLHPVIPVEGAGLDLRLCVVAPQARGPSGGLTVQTLPARLLQHHLGHHRHLCPPCPYFSHHHLSLSALLSHLLQPAGHYKRHHSVIYVFDFGLP